MAKIDGDWDSQEDNRPKDFWGYLYDKQEVEYAERANRELWLKNEVYNHWLFWFAFCNLFLSVTSVGLWTKRELGFWGFGVLGVSLQATPGQNLSSMQPQYKRLFGSRRTKHLPPLTRQVPLRWGYLLMTSAQEEEEQSKHSRELKWAETYNTS